MYLYNGGGSLTFNTLSVTAYNASYAPIPTNTAVSLTLEPTTRSWYVAFAGEGVEVNNDSTTLVSQPILDFPNTGNVTATLYQRSDESPGQGGVERRFPPSPSHPRAVCLVDAVFLEIAALRCCRAGGFSCPSRPQIDPLTFGHLLICST